MICRRDNDLTVIKMMAVGHLKFSKFAFYIT